MTDTPRTPKRSTWALAIILALLHVVLLLAVFVMMGRALFEGVALDSHIPVGGMSGIISVLLLVVAAAGGIGWLVPLLLVIMHIVQHTLPALDAVAFLHPLNASLMLLLGFWYWLELRRRRRAVTASASASAPTHAEPSSTDTPAP